MKIYKFIISKIFFRKVILGISVILLLFIANYVSFIAARSFLSSFQGYQEMKYLNQEGIYIANLDPNSDIDDYGSVENGIQAVYDYLNNNFSYAFYTGGYIVEIPNPYDMEITLSYMNEEYYKLNQFELSQGTDLDFDYQFGNGQEIPVLIGQGLSKTYPVGSTIRIEESTLGHPITLKVQGVLKQNAYHSNYHALNFKTYYNFTIFVPVDKEFINHADMGVQFNGLMGIAILQTTQEKVADLSEVMEDNLGMKFNFFSQKENFDDFAEYYVNQLKIMSVIVLILVVIITCLSVWNASVSFRLMLKNFTADLLVGLSYSKLRKIFYSYFGILSFINLAIIFTITAFERHGYWLRKETTIATYGLFGLIGMDWLALLVVVIFDIIIGMIIVESMLRKIKKVPVSL